MNILISEVATRDGLQSVKTIMDTAAKLRWIDAMLEAGVQEIEVASFVPAQLLPQMADAAQVVRYTASKPSVCVVALVPNLHGAKAAIQAGAHKLTIPVSVSEAHSLANVRKSRDDMLHEVRTIVNYRNAVAPQIKIDVGLSTAFGCTIQGTIEESEVLRLAAECAQCGVDDIGLSDTTGMANPIQVRRLFRSLQGQIGPKVGAAHMHNTRGLGLANCLAAFDVGITSFDSSLGGLGGCPYAPGASGNVVTEDLVYMFESMGVQTGIDLRKLLKARAVLRAGLPNEPLYGMTPEIGVPEHWHQGINHG